MSLFSDEIIIENSFVINVEFVGPAITELFGLMEHVGSFRWVKLEYLPGGAINPNEWSNEIR